MTARSEVEGKSATVSLHWIVDHYQTNDIIDVGIHGHGLRLTVTADGTLIRVWWPDAEQDVARLLTRYRRLSVASFGPQPPRTVLTRNLTRALLNTTNSGRLHEDHGRLLIEPETGL